MIFLGHYGELFDILAMLAIEVLTVQSLTAGNMICLLRAYFLQKMIHCVLDS